LRNHQVDLETYQSFERDFLGTETANLILRDLESREKAFTKDELGAITLAIQNNHLLAKYWREKLADPKTSDGPKEILLEEKAKDKGFPIVFSDELGEGIKRNIVEKIHSRAQELPIEDKSLAEFINLITAAFIEDEDFLESKIGGFYEYYEDIEGNLSIEAKNKFLSHLLDRGEKYRSISSDIADKVAETLIKAKKYCPRSLALAFTFHDIANEHDGNAFMENIKKSDYLKTQFLFYCYETGVETFEAYAVRLVMGTENIGEYFEELIKERVLPNDMYCSLLSKIARKNLLQGDVESFMRRSREVERILSSVKEEDSSLIYVSSLFGDIYALLHFIDDESKNKRRMNLDFYNLGKGLVRTPKQRRELCLKVSKFVQNKVEILERIITDRIFEEMNLFELSYFFTDINQVLLSFPSEKISGKLIKYLEERLDQYMDMFRGNPESFFSYMDSCERRNVDEMQQLFADLGILAISRESSKELFVMKKDKRVKLSNYGLPVINRKRTKSLRELDYIEATRIGEKYAQFVWEMLQRNKKEFLLDGLFLNLKHESNFCLIAPTQEILEKYAFCSMRYHLNGIFFPYLRKKKREEEGLVKNLSKDISSGV
jgi:hypothetical protein